MSSFNPKGIAETLTDRTAQVISARRYHAAASLQLVRAKRMLKAAEGHHTREGVDGKNAAEREANLVRLTAHELAALEDAEDELAKARTELDEAELNLQAIRDVLRCAEVEAKGAA